MHVIQVTGLALLWLWTGLQLTTAISCADRVSSGDKGVGISGIDDPNCPSAGGVGCFSDVPCRFCMTWSTPQSSHFIACSSSGGSTSSTPTVTPTTSTTPTAVATTTTANDDCPDGYPMA